MAITADLEDGARVCQEPAEQDYNGKANNADEDDRICHGGGKTESRLKYSEWNSDQLASRSSLLFKEEHSNQAHPKC